MTEYTVTLDGSTISEISISTPSKRAYIGSLTIVTEVGGTVTPIVAKPTFSPEEGTFTEAQNVAINCTTDGAIIYYTTDGSTPTDESEEYTGAITVSETTTIKAFAVKDGMNNSAVATATYTIKTVDPNWIDFTIQGFENAEDVTTVTGKNGSVTFAKATGSNAPKWYDTGSAVRIYTNNTITISAEEGKKIESVEFSITSGSMSADGFNVKGSYESNESNVFTLTAPTNSIVYTTTSNFRLDKIKINLSSDTREEAGLSYSAEEYTATIGEEYEFPTLSNPNSLTVSYASTNEDVATIDATGVITIIAAGETTIKATSEETDVYMAGSASYTLTVIDPNGPGSSVDNPYTVAQALEAIDALADNGYSATEVYIKGVVSGIKSIDVSKYERAQYYISDDGTETDQLLVYNGYYLEGVAFTANDQIQVGDEVVVYGQLQKYVKNGTTTPEVAQNNYLVSLDRPTRQKYYVIGDPDWDPTNMTEMTYNVETKAYEAELEVGETAIKFAIADQQMDASTWDPATGWADFNANHRYAYDDSEDGYELTKENSTDVQLQNYASSMVINTPGTYTLSLTEDLKLTVTGWTEEMPEDDTFVKVTSTSDLTDGYYLIVYEEGSVAFNGGLKTLDAVNNTIDVTIGDDKIVATEKNKAAMFYIDNTAGTLQSASGKYIGVSSNSNGLMQTEDAETYTNSFAIDEDGNAVISATFDGSTMTLRFNKASNQNRFRYYKSGQEAIALYKLTTATETEELAITSAGAASFSSTKALDFTDTDVTAYIITEKNGTTFERQAVTKVPANTGLVVEGAEGTYQIPVITDATAVLDDVSSNKLVATAEEAYTVTADDYGYVYGFFKSATTGKIGFQKKKADFTFGVGKSYLRLPAESPAKGAEFIYLGDAATGIMSVDGIEVESGNRYNLNGQRVGKNYKGIVIVNGKKAINK